MVINRCSPRIRSSLEMIAEREANDADVIRHEERIERTFLIQFRVAALLDALRCSQRTPIVANLRNQVNVDGQRSVARVSHMENRLELADPYSGERPTVVRAMAVDVSDSMKEYSSEITGRNISSSWMMRYASA